MHAVKYFKFDKLMMFATQAFFVGTFRIFLYLRRIKDCSGKPTAIPIFIGRARTCSEKPDPEQRGGMPRTL